MIPSQNLYRPQAVSGVANERLDELMRVTAPAGRLALFALGAMALAALVWSIFGTIAIKVRGNGILLKGSVLAVMSSAEGHVQEVLVNPGAKVKAGQPVVRLGQPDLELRIANQSAELGALRSQLGTERQAVSGIVGQLERRRGDVARTLAQRQRLLEKGLIERARVTETQRELTSIDQQIAQTRFTVMTLENKVRDVENELRELKQQLGVATVRSPYNGKVNELQVEAGELVPRGGPLMTIEPEDDQVTATIFVPVQQGKRIQKGMTVQISPDTVRREEYGVMVGEVVSVSSYPVTPEGLRRRLRNERLAASLAGEQAIFEVVVKPHQDPKTISKYRWSSSAGPPFEVQTGTTCSGAVEVEEKRPIAYVLPLFRWTVQGG